MTSLTLLKLNPRSPACRRDMANPQKMHKTMMSMFPPTSERPARQHLGVLWRIEPGNTPTLLLQSSNQPDFDAIPDGYAEFYCKSLDPHLASLAVGDFLLYRVVLNPARTSRMNGTNRQLVIPSADRPKWWTDRAAAAGLRLLDEPRLTGQQARRLTRQEEQFLIYSFRAEGAAEVKDSGALRQAIMGGIGRAKAWGCGLLTVVRMSV